MKKLFFNTVCFLMIFVGCNTGPRAINYGHDHCANCDMTVVDNAHAAQYLTVKGKSYVFDSIECMVMAINNSHDDKILLSQVLVSDFNNPGNLINVKFSTFLISEKIKSPMGANLSAFKSYNVAKEIQNEFGGELFNWEELKYQLN